MPCIQKGYYEYVFLVLGWMFIQWIKWRVLNAQFITYNLYLYWNSLWVMLSDFWIALSKEKHISVTLANFIEDSDYFIYILHTFNVFQWTKKQCYNVREYYCNSTVKFYAFLW